MTDRQQVYERGTLGSSTDRHKLEGFKKQPHKKKAVVDKNSTKKKRQAQGLVKIFMAGSNAERQYQDPVKIQEEGKNGFSFKIGGQGPKWRGEDSCDFKAIQEGSVSVTPIHLDLTNYDVIDELKSWEL